MKLGSAIMENLLRVARSEVAAGTAFASLSSDGGPPEIVSVPAPGTAEGLTSEELVQLVCQAAADPELREAPVIVRSVRMRQALTVAVAPLRVAAASTGDHRSMIGVVAGPDHRFEPLQLDVLERLARRLQRHLVVVQRLDDGTLECGAPASARSGAVGTRTMGLERGGPAPASSTRGSPTAAEPHAAPETEYDPAPDAGPKAPRRAPDGSPRDAADPPPATWCAEDAPSTWWAEAGLLAGLSSLGQFFSKAGRMLASDDRTTGGVAFVVVEVPDGRTTARAAAALRGQLRFSDRLARVDRGLLAVAIVLFPGATCEVIEQRLASAVGSVIERPEAVRTAHVVARPDDQRDVDELLRDAVSRLPGRR
ncbi:MAG: hypothetical protein ACRDV8_06780 [Acidimicrobiales bacterium]